ncbi:MAG: hypothetical protein IIZ33_03115 [Erysipelotrichaceae bacterium]|nr:hypothetical protein [Erysipelotrichaceae bacterium]
MRKVFSLFLILLLLTSCHKEVREDHYVLGLDEERLFAPGFDTLERMREIGFETELYGEFSKGDSAQVPLYYEGKEVGKATFTNTGKKDAPSEECILTYLELYVWSIPETLLLDGEEVPVSIKETCDRYEGDYLYKNGIACVIEKEDRNETVILHGDISAYDQDRIDRIEVFAD